VWFYEIYSDEESFKSHGGSDAFKAVMAKDSAYFKTLMGKLDIKN